MRALLYFYSNKNIVGSVLAIAAIVYALEVASKADTFVSSGAQTYMEANHLTSGTTFVAVPLIGQLGALLLAVGFVLTLLVRPVRDTQDTMSARRCRAHGKETIRGSNWR